MMMGDGGMSISYEKYFDQKFEAVNQQIESVKNEVETLADQLANMPCNDHNEKLTKIEQRLDNGDRFGAKVAGLARKLRKASTKKGWSGSRYGKF
jgi:conjugal transfer/entry exclusion protein